MSKSPAICSRVLIISAATPRPLSTTADPASASARAMPRPIPLVDPVTRETLPASGRVAAAPCVLTWMFMTDPLANFGANLPGHPPERKYPLAQETIGWRYGGSRVISGHCRLAWRQANSGQHDHGNAPGAIFPCGGAHIEFHARR